MKNIGILYIGNKLTIHGLTPSGVETLGAKLNKIGKVISVSDKKNRVLRLIDIIYSIIKYQNRVDSIIIDTYSSRAYYYAIVSSVLAQIFNKKYIPILRGGDLPTKISNNPFFANIIFKKSYTNIAPSLYLKHEYNIRGFKVKYIPNMVDIKMYPFKLRDKLEPRLLWVRSFHRYYNPLLAIRLFQDIKVKYPEAKLCMVGPDSDGSMRKVKKEIKKNGLIDDILITGKLSKLEWIKISENYDIFINTTNYDNHPVSIIEAMLLGMPIVSSNVGGINYLLRDGVDALLAKPRDKESFVNCIEKYINDNKFTQNTVNNAYDTALQFSSKKIETKWRNLLL